jgi:hypothetical protein
MTITASRNPTALTWNSYRQEPSLLDPNDGTPQDAITAFNWALLPGNARAVENNGRFRLPSTMRIEVTPVARVRTGAPQTADLLAHEQIHYDIGFVIARRLAHDLNFLDAPNEAQLRARLNELIDLHFGRRNELIQSRYDQESDHSQNAHYQRYWANNMRACLANPNASQIGGWML